MNASVQSMTAQRAVTAIAHAARATGVGFRYLLEQAKAESGLRPDAAARTSSARGLFQFVEGTWLATLKKHGAEHGLGWAADLIDSSGGRARVRDGEARRALLALRNDAETAALMAAEYAQDNAEALGRRLGRAVGGTELYLAHFLGPAGAARFLTAMAANPDADAGAVVPRAAGANARVFRHADGTPKSLAEVYDHFARRFGGDGAVPAPQPPERSVQTAQTIGPVQARSLARAAYMMLAGMGA
jgi:hypothetical protein